MTLDVHPSGPRPLGFGVLTGLLAGGVLVIGCAKQSPGASAPAGAHDRAAPEAAAEADEAGGWDDSLRDGDDPLATAQRQLTGYEDQLLDMGVELPDAAQRARADEGMSNAVRAEAGDRCSRVCELSTRICELRDRICELAHDHDDDERYGRACARATSDCERSNEACDGCDG